MPAPCGGFAGRRHVAPSLHPPARSLPGTAGTRGWAFSVIVTLSARAAEGRPCPHRPSLGVRASGLFIFLGRGAFFRSALFITGLMSAGNPLRDGLICKKKREPEGPLFSRECVLDRVLFFHSFQRIGLAANREAAAEGAGFRVAGKREVPGEIVVVSAIRYIQISEDVGRKGNVIAIEIVG